MSDKEKHLSTLADAFMASLTYHGVGTIGGDPDVDVMGVLGMDKNNKVDREYATKLIEHELGHYLRSEWLRMRNLGDL